MCLGQEDSADFVLQLGQKLGSGIKKFNIGSYF